MTSNLGSVQRRKGVFVGSGSDGMSDPRVNEAVLKLAQKSFGSSTSFHVLYLGTATYDLPQFANRQTQCLKDRGCSIDYLKLVEEAPSKKRLEEALDKAHIIVVGGGNTLYAVDRWRSLGLFPLLQKAHDRGAVLTGGSAGAICWFDSGHSDSMDPDTYYSPMMEKYGTAKPLEDTQVEESSSAVSGSCPPKDWKYIRVPGLGFFPGLVCPHHDRIQSNGVLRAHDFDALLVDQAKIVSGVASMETGIGIDHWAALVVDGEDYSVLSLEGKPGSVLYSDQKGQEGATFSAEAKGVPGIWIKRVTRVGEELQVNSSILPPQGNLGDHFSSLSSPKVPSSPEVEACRKENPDQGPLQE